MYVPARSAAAMIISPARASTDRPSTVIVSRSGLVDASAKGTRTFLDVDQELVAEHPEGGDDGRRDRGAKRADRGHVRWPARRPLNTGGDVVAHVHQEVEILDATAA